MSVLQTDRQEMAATSSLITTVDSKYIGNSTTSLLHLPTTLLQKLVCPAPYQQYLFTFLYDFFITRYHNNNSNDGGGYELPRTTRKLLLPGAVDECKDGGIPLDEL